MLFALIAALALGAATIFVMPMKAISPGHLVAGHNAVANDCLSCHKLGSGTPASYCSKCHREGEIGVKHSDGTEVIPVRQGLAGLHNSVRSLQCVNCHTDHRGTARDSATVLFSHSLLPAALASTCTECHDAQKPTDRLHQVVSLGCNECHSTEHWKPAQFKHDALAAEIAKDCGSCHASKTPADVLHKALAGQSCVSCHTTTAWKPATFEHTKYFRFDKDHPSRCADCHNMTASLKTYSCYNCHEHTPQKIASEHLEEGIRDYTNCVACHRSANKHEIQGRTGGNEGNRRGDEGDDD